ncbi:transcriptional repressor [Hyphococcus lacteus]|uniref:Transcriptional repressor n=1 Tax=Hyphococcus lacteus TaxID=3143536 RepID=A0ABV3Z644_9PROT
MGVRVEAPAAAAGQTSHVSSYDDFIGGTLKPNEHFVYDALRRSDTPLKAYELLEELHDKGLRAPMTIYRALAVLIDKGCVKKISSLNAYVAIAPERASEARAFLICQKCKHVKEVILDAARLSELFSPLEITSDNLTIEVYAECHQVCRDPKLDG